MARLLLHQLGGEHQGEGRAQPGDGQLDAHGEGHRPAFEPAGDASRDGRSGNLAAQAEEHDADVGDGKGGGGSAQKGPQHHAGAAGHHGHEEGAGETDAPLVQEDAAQHQPAEDAEDAVAAGIEAIAGRIPAQLREGGVFKEVGNAGEHVVEVVRCEHRHYQTGQHQPRSRAVEFLLCCHYSSALSIWASATWASDSEMLGSSRPSPFLRSTALSTKPSTRAATPRQASITRGAV